MKQKTQKNESEHTQTGTQIMQKKENQKTKGNKKMQKVKLFTLIELLVVIAIIAILAGNAATGIKSGPQQRQSHRMSVKPETNRTGNDNVSK